MHAFVRFRQRFFYFDATVAQILCLGSEAEVATWRLFSIEKWHIEKFRAVSSMQLENEGWTRCLRLTMKARTPSLMTTRMTNMSMGMNRWSREIAILMMT
jgi:hypothetical protein